MTCVRAHAHAHIRARALTRFDNKIVRMGRATLTSRRASKFSTIAGFCIKHLSTARAALNTESEPVCRAKLTAQVFRHDCLHGQSYIHCCSTRRTRKVTRRRTRKQTRRRQRRRRISRHRFSSRIRTRRQGCGLDTQLEPRRHDATLIHSACSAEYEI